MGRAKDSICTTVTYSVGKLFFSCLGFKERLKEINREKKTSINRCHVQQIPYHIRKVVLIFTNTPSLNLHKRIKRLTQPALFYKMMPKIYFCCPKQLCFWTPTYVRHTHTHKKDSYARQSEFYVYLVKTFHLWVGINIPNNASVLKPVLDGLTSRCLFNY